MKVKHPEVTVKLEGENSNVFNLIGLVMKAMREAGLSEEAKEFYEEVTSSKSYDEALQCMMRWVNVI